MRCCACKLRRGYFGTNRAGAGTRLIDGLRIRGEGGLGLGHRRGRELFQATVDGSGGTKSLA
jgi:hypothetical protein